ncbi:MAG: LacI family DNA-binding transcriptional regulator [Chloroflexota bacterium]|jgi:DNA-binding LacI/PurR family transcriptional regulator
MSNEEIPVQAIADLLERKPKEIKRVYDEWLASRKGRKDPLVPDIKLLASLTGLSTASVSNHLRNKPGSLSEGKAQRLSQLIELVGYVPSSAAQSLRGRHSNVIGIAVPLSTVSPDFHLEVLSGIKREADLLGYQQFIFDVTTIEARDEFFGSMPFLGIVDGLIVIGLYIDEARLRILNRHRLPIAVVNNLLTDPPVVGNVLSPDERALQELIDRHLIKHHGYRRIALVGLELANPLKMGDPQRGDWIRTGRARAYREALRLNGIEYDENLVVRVAGHTFEDGYQAYRRIREKNRSLPAGDQIEAVVCTSDTLAAAVLSAGRRNGTQLPVTGFDNLPLAELLDITTVDQRAKDVGRLAFRHLYNAMSYQKRKGALPEPVSEGIPTTPVIRSSCGCAH